jgi:hypothetical protein
LSPNTSITRHAKRADQLRAQVVCKNDDDTVRAYLRFWSESSTLDNARQVDYPDLKAFYLNYHLNELDGIVDMLRNETPIGIYYSSPTFASVTTSSEPVGSEVSDTDDCRIANVIGAP